VKILWHSNAPWAATGYGQQTALMLPRLAADGHDVACSAFYGLHGSALDWRGIRIYPGGADGFGNDVVVPHAITHFHGDAKSGATIALADSWVLRPDTWAKLAPPAVWAPIDHSPAPPRVVEFFRNSGATPIAMSRFGVRMLSDQGIPALYAPHAFDPADYYPGDRNEARERLGWPTEAFLVSCIGANKDLPPRKSWPEMLQAFARFRESHEDAILYLHTDLLGVAKGVNLGQLLASLDVPPRAVIVADQYESQVLGADRSYMRDVLVATDVVLHASRSEGFGVVQIEAQACGTPVIATQHSAMPEVVEAGWLVGGQPDYTYQESWMAIPDVEEIVWALGEAYTSAAAQADRAVEFAKQYEADVVFKKYWKGILREIEDRVEAEAKRAKAKASPPAVEKSAIGAKA